nr:hypothetical protein CFP56_58727 [Quercus suber]
MSDTATTTAGIPRQEIWAICQVAMMPVSCVVALYAADKLGWVPGAGARVGEAVMTVMTWAIKPAQEVYRRSIRNRYNDTVTRVEDVELGETQTTAAGGAVTIEADVHGHVVAPAHDSVVEVGPAHRDAIDEVESVRDVASVAEAQHEVQDPDSSIMPAHEVDLHASTTEDARVHSASFEWPLVPQEEPVAPSQAHVVGEDDLAMLTE